MFLYAGLITGRVSFGSFSFARAKKMNTPVGARTDAFDVDLKLLNPAQTPANDYPEISQSH